MDQVAEYRAQQQRRFEAQQRLQQQQDNESPSRDAHAAEQDASRVQRRRPSALADLKPEAEFLTTAACSSCPGTPREYRERQQQRFAAEQLRRQQELHSCSADVQQEVMGRHRDGTSNTSDSGRANQVELQADSSASFSCSCPGTPKEYIARQQQRFVAEQLQHQQEQQQDRELQWDIAAQATQRSVAEEPKVAACTGSILRSGESPSPPTPRQRGSAGLRAISAARAMRADDAAPLPGAAWPGHSQSNDRPQSASRSGQGLPPRPPTPAGSARLQRSSSRSSLGLPPRPRASCGQANAGIRNGIFNRTDLQGSQWTLVA